MADQGEGGEDKISAAPYHPGESQVAVGCRAYLGFQQVIKGLMMWCVWSIVRASRSQWRAHSWRKRGSLQRQREGA